VKLEGCEAALSPFELSALTANKQYPTRRECRRWRRCECGAPPPCLRPTPSSVPGINARLYTDQESLGFRPSSTPAHTPGSPNP
jgi:hypothetical protein